MFLHTVGWNIFHSKDVIFYLKTFIYNNSNTLKQDIKTGETISTFVAREKRLVYVTEVLAVIS